jgi:hypothetical protein
VALGVLRGLAAGNREVTRAGEHTVADDVALLDSNH